MSKLTHLDEKGAARMVDISGKEVTEREAAAEASIVLSTDAFAAIAAGEGPKGDVLATARIAGILAAKKTSELIPLCHPLAITKATVDFELLESSATVRVLATIKTSGQTGVEMEALTAASIAALTIYDMVKAIDKAAEIGGVRLIEKSGGKSGDYTAPARARADSLKLQASPRTKAQARARPAAFPDAVSMPSRQQVTLTEREAFRTFMTSRRLRATEWAKEAGVPASQIYAYLTGRTRALPPDVARRLASVAQVRVEDLFR